MESYTAKNKKVDNYNQSSRSKKICDTIKSKKYNKPVFPKWSRKTKVQGKITNYGFIAKYLSQKFLPIDQSKYFRVSSLIFCSSFFEGSGTTENPKLKEESFRPFFLLMNFKRIVRIEKLINTNVWYFHLEERFSNECFHLDLTNTIKIFNKFSGSENPKCKVIAILLENYFETLHLLKSKMVEIDNDKFQKTINAQKVGLIELDFLNELNILYENDKTYYIKIDDKITGYIYSKPFFAIQKDYWIQNKPDTTIGFFQNQSFCDQIGLNRIKLDHEFEGFEVFKDIYCNDWASLYEKIIQFSNNWSETKCELEPRELHVRKSNLKKKHGNFVIYKQCYYEKPNRFMYELFFVFIVKKDIGF